MRDNGQLGMKELRMSKGSNLNGQILPLERVGLYSILVNVFLLALNSLMAALSGSLALIAEIVHNLADLLSAVAVYLGLKVSQRKHRAFPYGLYKVENLVAVVVAFFIFFTAYEIAREALAPNHRQVLIHPWMLAGVLVAAIVPWLFSRFELRYGRMMNSPSLIADAKEFEAHVLSSGVIFAALLGQWVGWPLDWPAALLIVLWIVWVGWETLRDSMRVLLDASVDTQTLDRAKTIIMAQPAVSEIHSLIGRNAGRYRFLEVEVELNVSELEKAHRIGHQIEEAIRKDLTYVERVLVHTEPSPKPMRRTGIPLVDQAGTVSVRFCTAPYYLFTDIDNKSGEIQRQRTVVNPFSDVVEDHGRGLKVSQWLIDEGVDVLITREDIRKKGAGYTLNAAGVSIILSTATDAESALAESRLSPHFYPRSVSSP